MFKSNIIKVIGPDALQFVADSLVKAKEIKLRILNELYGLGNTDMFVDFFREQISTKRTKHTKETYEIVLRKILRAFENAEERRFADITYDWVLQFKRYLEDSGLSCQLLCLILLGKGHMNLYLITGVLSNQLILKCIDEGMRADL